MAKKDVSDAAQKVADAEKASAKASNKANKPSFFKRAGKAIPKFFKDFKGEIKKIVWPDLKTVVKSTGVVLVCVLIIGIFIWIVDFGLTKGISSVRHLASSHSTSTEETTAAAEEGTTVADLVIEDETKVEETKAAGEATTAAETGETTTVAEKAETTAATAETAAAETAAAETATAAE